MDIDFSKLTITVVGLGVIGGSFAMAIKEQNIAKLYGIDIDENTIKYAIENNIIDEGFICNDISLKRALEESDIVIICLYPVLIKKFVEDNIDSFKEGAIITDAAGVKGTIEDEISNIINSKIDFIFGHPMAGREKKGIMFASSDVFKGANYIITPTPYNKEENLLFMEKFISTIGFSKISKISPKKHDEVISYTSQLPHAIAVGLINSDSFSDEIWNYVGDSFKELTRIARINEDLWAELFFENKENLIKQIDLFQENMDNIKNALLSNDYEVLINNLIKARKRREGL